MKALLRPWFLRSLYKMLLLLAAWFPYVTRGSETIDKTHAGFVGTWELRSVDMQTSDGRVTAVWGADPVGRLIYDDQGRVFALLMPKARNQAAGQTVPEELQREVAGYFGTYALDTKKKIVTHHVAVSLRAAESGELERAFILQGDTLILTANAMRADRPVTYVLTWQRATRQDRGQTQTSRTGSASINGTAG